MEKAFDACGPSRKVKFWWWGVELPGTVYKRTTFAVDFSLTINRVMVSLSINTEHVEVSKYRQHFSRNPQNESH